MIEYIKPRIVTRREAEALLAEGYQALDPHCHSAYSYDVPDVKETSPEIIFKKQKSLKLMNVLTDHDTLNGFNHLKHKGFKTIPAVELTFRPKIARKVVTNKPFHTTHINVFCLNDHDLIMLKEIAARGDFDELVKYFVDNDLEWMYNHPLYHEKREHLNWRAIPSIANNYFDVIELNCQFSKGLNNINQRLAEKLGKGIAASSDSHTGRPGEAFVIADGKNFRDFWDNVKSGNAYIMRRDMGTWDVMREASLIINQAFNANTHPRIDKRYTPETGFRPFDKIAKSVTSGSLKNQFIMKKVIKMTLQSLQYTAGPVLAWRLHVTKDEEKAEYIRRRIQLVTNKIKELQNNIQNSKQYRSYIKNVHHPRIPNIREEDRHIHVKKVSHAKKI
jgi:predicted metal-dependent phosphoesterase TrpH